jgi:hypothetical protein
MKGCHHWIIQKQTASTRHPHIVSASRFRLQIIVGLIHPRVLHLQMPTVRGTHNTIPIILCSFIRHHEPRQNPKLLKDLFDGTHNTWLTRETTNTCHHLLCHFSWHFSLLFFTVACNQSYGSLLHSLNPHRNASSKPPLGIQSAKHQKFGFQVGLYSGKQNVAATTLTGHTRSKKCLAIPEYSYFQGRYVLLRDTYHRIYILFNGLSTPPLLKNAMYVGAKTIILRTRSVCSNLCIRSRNDSLVASLLVLS